MLYVIFTSQIFVTGKDNKNLSLYFGVNVRVIGRGTNFIYIEISNQRISCFIRTMMTLISSLLISV